MGRRKPCRIADCTNPWAAYKGGRSPFCADHLWRLDQNRRYQRTPVLDLRVVRSALLNAVPDTPNISPADWSAFQTALGRYRDMALDQAFTAGAQAVLAGLDPLARHELRERCARAAADTAYDRVLDLDLVADPAAPQGYRVETRDALEWSA